jgi:hypothetical protein
VVDGGDLGGGSWTPERWLRVVVLGDVSSSGGRVWLASAVVRATERRGLGCRAAALGNLVGSAPGVGSGGVAALAVDYVVWC